MSARWTFTLTRGLHHPVRRRGNQRKISEVLLLAVFYLRFSPFSRLDSALLTRNALSSEYSGPRQVQIGKPKDREVAVGILVQTLVVHFAEPSQHTNVWNSSAVLINAGTRRPV